jgi:hypothetical protein
MKYLASLSIDGTTTKTHADGSYMGIYRNKGWKPVKYSWTPLYRRVAFKRYCTGYKKSAFNHRTVEACGAWVRSVDREARYFFFRDQSNWHCSPCPLNYDGSTARTAVDNSYQMYTY